MVHIRLLALGTRGDVQPYIALGLGLKRAGYAVSVAAAEPIPSFLIECLVYNVPDTKFGNTLYTQDMKNVIYEGWEATRPRKRPSRTSPDFRDGCGGIVRS